MEVLEILQERGLLSGCMAWELLLECPQLHWRVFSEATLRRNGKSFVFSALLGQAN